MPNYLPAMVGQYGKGSGRVVYTLNTTHIYLRRSGRKFMKKLTKIRKGKLTQKPSILTR